jgi:phosphonate transport system substrate-binding protein
MNAGDRTSDAGAPRPFRFSFAPTIAAEERFAPDRAVALTAYLERALGRSVEIVPVADYDAALTALAGGRLDAAMLGEAASRRGQESGGVVPLVAPAGGGPADPTYQTAIVTRIDAGIHDLSGLRGATFGLVDARSTSGFLVPRAMLREAGLDPDRDVETRLLGQHQAVVEAVIAGEVAAGAVHAGRLRPPSLDRGPDYARLRSLATSRPIPLGPLVVRADLDEPTRQALTAAMLRVHEADPDAAQALLRAGLRFTLATKRATPTLKSIAALAGVSYATVSRVVNGSDYVAPATAARVRAIVDELGYRPNGNALTLQGQRAPLVGLVVPPRPNDAVTDLADRLRSALQAAGVPFVLCPVVDRLRDSPFLDLLQDGRLGVLVVTAAHADDPSLARLARTGRAVVVVGAEVATPGMVVAAPRDAPRAVLSVLGLTPIPAMT